MLGDVAGPWALVRARSSAARGVTSFFGGNPGGPGAGVAGLVAEMRGRGGAAREG